MRRWRQAARAAVGAGGGGPSGPALPLDWTTDLTFARASAATHWDGTTFRTWASGEARVLPSGALYVEGARTNRYDDHDDYTASANATITDDAAAAPDGTTTADLFESTASLGLIRSEASANPYDTYAFSVFVKSAGGEDAHQIILSTGGLSEIFSFDAPASWGRIEVIDAVDTGAGNSRHDVREAAAGNDSTSYVWGWQMEAGAFASQLIQTSGGASSRLADDAAVASASVPAALRSGAWEVTITPRRASTEAADASTETLFAFGTGTDNRVHIDASNRIVVRQGGSDAVTTGALTWDADQAITLTFDASAGSVTVSGATTGDGTTTDTSWTMPAGDLQVGNDAALATPFFGAISAPAAP